MTGDVITGILVVVGFFAVVFLGVRYAKSRGWIRRSSIATWAKTDNTINIPTSKLPSRKVDSKK